MMELLARYDLARTSILYVRKEETVGLLLVPAAMMDEIAWNRDCRVEPLVQLRLVGDSFCDGFTNGLSLRGGESTGLLRLKGQEVRDRVIETWLTDERGYEVVHRLEMLREADAVRTCVEFFNHSGHDACLELLSSFALGCLSPFDEGESELYIHRFQSFWSAEGRHRCDSIADLHLEKAWLPFAVRTERYGSIGSMPVRKFFPFGAVEDRRRGVFWGAQLAHPASWQMELSMQDDALLFSGGLADRDFGHWMKRLAPGESFRTPQATLAVVAGTLDDLGNRLTAVQREPFLAGPEGERTLPVAFNEYCTTWGNPSLENIKRIADTLEGRGVRYFVIDCGWYGHVDWTTCMGDWEPDATLFPGGLREAADYIRSRGMIPGLWFEMESVGVRARAFGQEEHLLRRDGATITVGTRRFWNMTDPWVQDYLGQRVIGLLKACGFGYLKVDYNNSLGIGCDGCESLGEGLRRNMEATQAFFRRIREEIPGIVIENCASGGHRLEPSMMALVSQASFSDAHECVSIPIIAANLHRLIHPAQSQIWAVIRREDDEERLYYSIANTFLGRMCLSGDVCDLTPRQNEIIDEGIRFYEKIAPLILWGESFRFGPEVVSYGHPEGWQGMLRRRGDEALYVVHAYGGAETLGMPEGWRIADSYGSPGIRPAEDGRSLRADPRVRCAKAFLLKKA